jgi:hypothetical protein
MRDCEEINFAGAEAMTCAEGKLQAAFVCDGAWVGLDLASEKAWLRLRFSGTQVLADR